MFKGEFIFNLDNALTRHFSPQYYSAYPSTNEPIEEWHKLIPVKNPRVLTVAASGDQPLFHALMGASHVDTFDITINACVIMDFKTTALQLMNYSEYLDAIFALKNLDSRHSFNFINGLTNHHHFMNMSFRHTIDNMPQRTRTLMRNIVKRRPDAFQRDMKTTKAFPRNQNQYEKLQQIISTPFNFIWSNLKNVTNYTQETYDIINTSNIFDHYLRGAGLTPEDIFETIKKLWPQLNVGGYIMCTTVSEPTHFIHIQHKLSDMHAEVSFPARPSRTNFSPIVIQKTR